MSISIINDNQIVGILGQQIADGRPGSIAKKLRELILHDIQQGLHGVHF